ncbi:MAG: hypothetical protein K8W52_28870 [Deltaproteobacteria bacterium]|nr:hypothetical protein [Deltaproteobacteria bacterium]
MPDITGAAKAAPSGGAWAIIKKRWRGWLRAFHRDLGYLVVGLTLIYAVSGLAINHLADWDPNFTTHHTERTIDKLPAELPDDVAIARAAAALGVEPPEGAARYGDEIHFDWPDRNIVVYGDSGLVIDDGRESRFFLRVANWLHYNRGKKAWTYVADAYAIILLYLAISGLFMIKGRLGLKWRGLILVTLGAGVPTLYVVISGGPSAKHEATAAVPTAEGAATPDAPAPEPPPDRMPERPPVRTPMHGEDTPAEGTRPPVRTPMHGEAPEAPMAPMAPHTP